MKSKYAEIMGNIPNGDIRNTIADIDEAMDEISTNVSLTFSKVKRLIQKIEEILQTNKFEKFDEVSMRTDLEKKYDELRFIKNQLVK